MTQTSTIATIIHIFKLNINLAEERQREVKFPEVGLKISC